MDRLPVLAIDLILELDKAYPHRCIGPVEDPIRAHRYAGKRELIDKLLSYFNASLEAEVGANR